MRAVDPAPGSGQARYEIFHDRLAAPILDWRQQRENARLDRARERAEQEAEVQRTQARRFKRRARIMFALAVGLLVLLVAVAVLLGYAQHQSDAASREKTAALRGRDEATYFGLTARAQSQLSTRPDVSLLLYLAAYDQSPQPRRRAEPGGDAALGSAVRRVSGSCTVTPTRSRASRSARSAPRWLRRAATRRSGCGRSGGPAHFPLGRPLQANDPLYSVAFDPTGQVLASGSFNDIILWNIHRHARQGTIPRRHRCGDERRVQPARQHARRRRVLTELCSSGTQRLTSARRCTSRTEDWCAALRSARAEIYSRLAAANRCCCGTSPSGTRLGAPLSGPIGTVLTRGVQP